MLRRVSWREKEVDVGAAEADAELEAMKSFDIDKSQSMACTICPEAEHKMRYRLLMCSSETCVETSALKCAWRGKIVTCLATEHASIFEFGDHNTLESSPKRKKLTSTQKVFCRDLADNHLRPMRIRHALSRKFSTPLEELSSKKTDLGSWIHERAYSGAETMTEPFTFGWQINNAGKPVAANGSDDKPFIVGLTAKALMLRLLAPPFILHLDATNKMSQ
ncbi:hypothetical protein PC128_g21286 [Phytophthora cactorum]|nr:hypothetical protein PC128_g21286 [Phytophthora cactorum]KAG4040865.1 hypothetical protein PC123_g23605 [Phytophthora cactorum]